MKTVDQRTLAYFEGQGYVIDKAERQLGKIKRDLFGFIDFVAVHPDRDITVGVQATGDSGGNFAARKRKILEHKNYPLIRKKWDICLIAFKTGQDEPSRVEWF